MARHWMMDPYTWLMQNAGPVVRWRTATELIRDSCYRKHLTEELISHPAVRKWLERLSLDGLPTPLDMLDAACLKKLGSMVHGGKATCLENVFGKLAEFGLRAGMPQLDQRPLPFAIFHWEPDWKKDIFFQVTWERLMKSIFAWGLLRLGYPPDEPMQHFMLNHLDTCYKIARDKVYDIYADEDECAQLPKEWAEKPILKQEVMTNYWLPYIHDLYVFANFPDSMLNDITKCKINTILDYVLDPRFQNFRDGYGYAWIKERRFCYGWGWSPHFTKDPSLLLRIELLAHFKHAQESALFKDLLAYLETFAHPEGRYLFPAEYLHESEGYYIGGYGMGLAENRRNPAWIEIESTFRILKIKSLLDPAIK